MMTNPSEFVHQKFLKFSSFSKLTFLLSYRRAINSYKHVVIIHLIKFENELHD